MNEEKNRYLNPMFIIGKGGDYSITIEEFDLDTDDYLNPMNLQGCSIELKVLGSTNQNAKVLLEKNITMESNIETVGQILNPETGEFILHFTPEDTNNLGVNRFPFTLRIYDSMHNELVDLSSMNTGNEFNSIDIVNF